jgi:dipeptidyl aminopeptidase/acylaminoacyl peptidase
MAKIAPYGLWKSPITSDLIVAKMVGLGEIVVEGDLLYWTEMRPEEKGRIAVVRRSPDGQTTDLLPPPWNVRTRVHEYGGGSFLVSEGVLYFSNFADQRLYRLVSGKEPEPLTPAVDLRYADYVMDGGRGRLIGVREDHTGSEVVNTIASIALDGSDLERGGQVLVSGKDFYSNPRLSPDGTRLCWLEWNHPNMPWDGTELWVARIAADGSLSDTVCIAGGESESIFQPTWSPDGVLYFVSDRTGWWNLYRWQDGQTGFAGHSGHAEALHPMEAEFGEPQWVFRMTTFAFESAERLVCLYVENGQSVMAMLNTRTLDFQPVSLPYTDINNLQAVPGRVFFIGGSPTMSRSAVQLNLDSGEALVLRKATSLVIDSGYLSVPEPIEFPTENGLTAHAFYYPPRNQDFMAPTGELPPVIVSIHGGPTGSTSTVLSLGIQYWTSRGIGIVDVNYGGSTGYGRAYRERLNGQWGIVDVDDCVNAALYLARSGKADPQRLAIHGGSAGGYTTLAALAFRKVFRAGASHYGVSDAEALAMDTHKFESRYLDGLIGPYPAARDVYVARSPIHFTHQLDCALILFQGAEDKVVPPDQSRKMYEAVRAKGLPVAYLEFPGEQHGFRQAEHIRRSLDGELYFYSKVFGFDLADPVKPVEIDNL